MIKRWLLILAAVASPVTQVGMWKPSRVSTRVSARCFTRESRRREQLFTSIGRGLAPLRRRRFRSASSRMTAVSISLATSQGNGCPPGKYAVLVEWRDGTGDGVVPVKTKGKTKLVKRSRVRSGPDRLNGRYFDISKPLLHAEVLPQSNTLPPFELGG